MYPFSARLNSEKLESALVAFFANERAVVADELGLYRVNDDFRCESTELQRHAHVDPGASKNILYRPKIVNAIIVEIKKALPDRCGVMVNGPHGVGKSHSLVNVVRKLESTGDYLVTFTPDCEHWTTFEDLCIAICKSFGVTMEELEFRPELMNHETMFRDLGYFVGAVDNILKN